MSDFRFIEEVMDFIQILLDCCQLYQIYNKRINISNLKKEAMVMSGIVKKTI